VQPDPGEPPEPAEPARQHGRGRDASTPSEIPAKGWKDIAKRTVTEVKDDNVPLLAGGVAFFGLLSLFPALVAVVSIYGIVADPDEVADQLESITTALPDEAADLIVAQAESVAAGSTGALGLSVAIGVVLALWSASSGMKWLMSALSLVYEEKEERTFVPLRGTALLLTFGAALGFAVSVAVIAAAPPLASTVGLGDTGSLVVSVLRWPLLGAGVIAALAVLYRYGPDRDTAQWGWVSWGSAIAAVIWLVASAGFSVYASQFGDFEESYGALSGIVVLMLWLFLTAFAILLGGEINAEMEHQTAVDTTAGDPQPLGERDAVVADDVGADADTLGEKSDKS
jgi:membrane protein